MSDHGTKGGSALDREVDVRAMAISMVALALIMVVSAVLMWALASHFQAELAAADPPVPVLPAARQAWQPPEPRLQADPEGELRAMRADESRDLGGLEWTDPQGEIARIPIEEAMALVAANGSEGVGLGPTAGAAAAGDSGEAATP